MTEEYTDMENNNGSEQQEISPKVNSEKKEDNNVIFIGSKPLVNYIRGVVTQFRRRNADEVIIKSRGKFISKAVDVAEVSRRNLGDAGVKIKDIKISSESFETEGKKTNISTMDIVLVK